MPHGVVVVVCVCVLGGGGGCTSFTHSVPQAGRDVVEEEQPLEEQSPWHVFDQGLIKLMPRGLLNRA